MKISFFARESKVDTLSIRTLNKRDFCITAAWWLTVGNGTKEELKEVIFDHKVFDIPEDKTSRLAVMPMKVIDGAAVHLDEKLTQSEEKRAVLKGYYAGAGTSKYKLPSDVSNEFIANYNYVRELYSHLENGTRPEPTTESESNPKSSPTPAEPESPATATDKSHCANESIFDFYSKMDGDTFAATLVDMSEEEYLSELRLIWNSLKDAFAITNIFAMAANQTRSVDLSPEATKILEWIKAIYAEIPAGEIKLATPKDEVSEQINELKEAFTVMVKAIKELKTSKSNDEPDTSAEADTTEAQSKADKPKKKKKGNKGKNSGKKSKGAQDPDSQSNESSKEPKKSDSSEQTDDKPVNSNDQPAQQPDGSADAHPNPNGKITVKEVLEKLKGTAFVIAGLEQADPDSKLEIARVNKTMKEKYGIDNFIS